MAARKSAAQKQIDKIEKDLYRHVLQLEAEKRYLSHLNDSVLGYVSPNDEIETIQRELLQTDRDRAANRVDETERSIEMLKADLAAAKVRAGGYKVGDIVTKRNGDRVLVTSREADVKNGEPGYLGRRIETNELGYPQPSESINCFGYDDAIVEVESR